MSSVSLAFKRSGAFSSGLKPTRALRFAGGGSSRTGAGASLARKRSVRSKPLAAVLEPRQHEHQHRRRDLDQQQEADVGGDGGGRAVDGFRSCELLVLGSGIAGLTCALEAADLGTRVAVVTKSNIMEGSTKYAQGGVAAVMSSESASEGGGGPKTRVAAEAGQEDCVAHHVEDTMNAGCYLNDREAVEIMCREGPERVEMLCQIGVPFTKVASRGSSRDNGAGGSAESAEERQEEQAQQVHRRDAKGLLLHLGKEGGHSHSRVVHAADATGRAMMNALVSKVKAHPNITVHENVFALDLLTMPLQQSGDGVSPSTSSSTTSILWQSGSGSEGSDDGGVSEAATIGCYGCDGVDLNTGAYLRFASKCTVVATGGCGQIYPETTNPGVATGDGIAMAARAGARVKNMEFIQFHPTSLFVNNSSSSSSSSVRKEEEGDIGSGSDSEKKGALDSVFLISEAVRGAGAVLRNAKGERFMPRYDARADLAPRDIVARGIYDQMRVHGTKHVFLDVTHLSRDELEDEFPNIFHHVLSTLGLDMSESWIPVVPAQHYACGGILTNVNGQTNVRGLYAIGEAACTGVHGANRLASNSLLEGLVFGKRAASHSRTVENPAQNWNRLVAAPVSSLVSLPNLSDEDEAEEEEDFVETIEAAAETEARVQRDMRVLQEIVWKHAGILRNDSDIARGLQAIRDLKRSIGASANDFHGTSDRRQYALRQAELVNMAAVAELVLAGAKKRKTSAGLHFNVDRPPATLPPEPKASNSANQRPSQLPQHQEAPVPLS